MSRGNVLVLALILSLGANLALAGFIAGRMHAARPAPVAMDPYVNSLRALRDLPDERQAAIRPLLREHLRALRPNVREMRRAQGRIKESLAADPFDPEALTEALAGFRSALLESQERSHGALVELAATLSPDERLVLREVLTRSPRMRLREAGGLPVGSQ